ncbi:MAG: hypothetical protein MUE36_07225 [Acidimicrobiales bacterium]|jgi:hypothetical protein|nr:hypothetical protein [Acidimicrobiales bacterium]
MNPVKVAIDQAAWVPERDDMDWDQAAALAIDWVEDRCRDEGGARAVVVTNTIDSIGHGALEQFARAHDHTTRRSRGARPGRPVLAYCVQLEDLEYAQNLGRRSSLVAVEGFSVPLSGWAAVVGAEDLATGEPAEYPAELTETVERLAFYGNNGFGDSYGKRQADRIVAGLSGWTADQLSALPAAAVGAGVSAKGAKNLQKLIERHSGRR